MISKKHFEIHLDDIEKLGRDGAYSGIEKKTNFFFIS